ncbi:MAG: hypothetical protein ACOYJG_04280 [Prevotella sp.]
MSSVSVPLSTYSERSIVYLRVLASGNRTGGTWRPTWWHLALDWVALVSNRH